ncbi:unsaturated rhamnogalacturonyl hydrolase [Reichenbachiella faecimaris]|uniref:Unsaturated rhamnogalacturonyl hydrolase n=1 Tax=Reichenbachiella faecimaris TaxID=692418 RepID=A0A1W2G7L7_REIFA|nr:glycoside hydrolase family 88 protein [Reichenbachiella faecimaris]SMD32286.1 unsaturated rhamnogalacturonyl hydrolase [Reichenbachiella faecimaris]
MNRLKHIILLITISACSQSVGEKISTSTSTIQTAVFEQMANSELIRHPDPRLLDFRETPKWEYSNGLVCSAMMRTYEATGKEKFLNYVKFYADSLVREDGSIKTYKKSDFNIDRINSGKILFDLYKKTGDEKYRLAIETLRDQMRHQPRLSSGGFWHKKIYPYQMWLDGLYMGSPFLAEYAKEFNEPALFDDVANQFILIDSYTWDEEKQLFYHGYDESREQKWSNAETGVSPNFWGRAIGWYAMALVDVLDYLPEDHSKRPQILAIITKMANGLVKYQDEETGLWWQIMDRGGDEGNYLEASCSSMFSYFFLKAVEHGYLAASYREIANKSYEGVLDSFIKSNKDGTISLTTNCAVAGLGGEPYRDASYEYYVNEPKRDNDPKGVGPFIMASIIYENEKQESQN